MRKYCVSVFGTDTFFTTEEKAMGFARDADWRYASGFVQVYSPDGEMIYGRSR